MERYQKIEKDLRIKGWKRIIHLFQRTEEDLERLGDDNEWRKMVFVFIHNEKDPDNVIYRGVFGAWRTATHNPEPNEFIDDQGLNSRIERFTKKVLIGDYPRYSKSMWLVDQDSSIAVTQTILEILGGYSDKTIYRSKE